MATATHYFDDIFSRHRRRRSSGRPHIRRSSTSRSIGNRSDFATTSNDGYTPGVESALDEDEYAEPDEHVSHYVESQLERVKSRASVGAYEDEFETET